MEGREEIYFFLFLMIFDFHIPGKNKFGILAYHIFDIAFTSLLINNRIYKEDILFFISFYQNLSVFIRIYQILSEILQYILSDFIRLVFLSCNIFLYIYEY